MSMQPLGHEAMELFNEILATQRRQGRRIEWADLQRAAQLAREFQEEREKGREQ